MARAIADLIGKGYSVFLPINSTSPFDLVIYADGIFRRVQVKYISAVNGVMQILNFRKGIYNGQVKKRPNVEVDVLCIFNPDTDRCYYLPPCETFTLRIEPTKNGYSTGVHMASDYCEVPSTALLTPAELHTLQQELQ